jgi:REP element-mobilizing transposase RayT
MRAPVREKQHRLPSEVYSGLQVVSFTACLKDSVTFFTTGDRFTACERMLLDSLGQFDSGAEAYLFMPNHAHLLLRGLSEKSDVLRAMKSFKQQSGHWLYKEHPRIRWQKDFYDHILRKEEEVRKHILYILNNPVRKGMVEHWKAYLFKGSTIHILDEWEDA